MEYLEAEMANMSYCRFRNTLADLRDCADHLIDQNLSEEEERARTAMVALCRDIAADYPEEDD